MPRSRRALLGLIVILTTVAGQTRAAEDQANATAGAQTFAISGNTGEPEVSLKGFPGRMVQSDKHGNYDVKVPYGWSGVVRPVKEGYDFDPPERNCDSVMESLAGQDYSATRKMCTISGSIIIDGQPTPGVKMTADGGVGFDITDADGRYSVKIPYGWSGRLTATKEGIEFEPPSKLYENVKQDIDEDALLRRAFDNRWPRKENQVMVARIEPSHRIRIVPTSKANPEVFTAVADDMQVMLHILRKNLSKKTTAMAGVFPDYGDLLARDQDRLEGLYVQGYGAFLFVEAELIRSAPLEKKADEGQTGSTPADPVWDQARQEIGGQPAGGAIGTPYGYGPYGPGPYGGLGGTAGALLPNGWKPDELLKELIQTFRHASNIRHLDPNELITLSVIGRIPMPLPGVGDPMVYGGMGMAPDPMAQPDMLRWLKETSFTLQARKADIDQFARGQLTQDQFRQKVKVLTY